MKWILVMIPLSMWLPTENMGYLIDEMVFGDDPSIDVTACENMGYFDYELDFGDDTAYDVTMLTI